MIEIIKPGFHTLIQDSGRKYFQEFGMPVSGVMDMDSYRIANFLVGNKNQEAVLEIAMTGPKIIFSEATEIGITGADLEAKLNGVLIRRYETIQIVKGDILSFGKLIDGFRCYVAVNGGFEVDPQLKSRSTYAYAKLGGAKGRALCAGDRIPIGLKKTLSLIKIPKEYYVKTYSVTSIRVIAGPEFDAMKYGKDSNFFTDEFRIENSSNRMGYRLNGNKVALDAREMLSSGVVNGTIQLPPEGVPIVLLADAQTTGGYPRVANVIKSDIPLLAQLKPGDRLRFRLVSLKEAQANYYNKEKRIKDLIGFS